MGQLPRTIASGETLPILAKLAPSFTEGDFSQPFDLRVAGFRRRFRISLDTVDVLPFPERVDLGPFDRSIVKVIDMHDLARSAGMRVVSAVCKDERLTLTVRAADRLELSVHTLEVGERVDTFCDVAIEGSAPLERQRLWVTGMASAGLLVEPMDLVFGLLRVQGPSVTKEARVRAVDGRAFELATKDIQDPGLVSIAIREIAAGELIVGVTIEPKRRGMLDIPIKLTTSDQMRGVTLRCVGTIE